MITVTLDHNGDTAVLKSTIVEIPGVLPPLTTNLGDFQPDPRNLYWRSRVSYLISPAYPSRPVSY